MLNLKSFSEAQHKIINHICLIQLESLQRIQDNNQLSDQDLIMLLITEDIPKEEWESALREKISRFETLKENPTDLRVLDESDLSIFRHILANIEEDFQGSYPNAVSNLWQRLFLIEELYKGSSDYSRLN